MDKMGKEAMGTVWQAKETEFEAVRALYHQIIKEMEGAPYSPGWAIGIYPTDAYLKSALRKGELYCIAVSGAYAGAMILDHHCNEGYASAAWQVQAEVGEVTVIHALGTLPAYQGKGLGKRLVEEAIRLAREGGQKAIRLDVLKGNEPAKHLYTGMGFAYRDALTLYYEDTGWTDFYLYELAL